jgi:hypothetical protein
MSAKDQETIPTFSSRGYTIVDDEKIYGGSFDIDVNIDYRGLVNIHSVRRKIKSICMCSIARPDNNIKAREQINLTLVPEAIGLKKVWLLATRIARFAVTDHAGQTNVYGNSLTINGHKEYKSIDEAAEDLENNGFIIEVWRRIN